MAGKPLADMTLDELWALFPILLQPHNPQYGAWYGAEKCCIMQAVGDRDAARVSHIGSTAVAGLLAKPTVDILLELDGACNVARVTDALTSVGWGLMLREDDPFKLEFCKGYTPESYADRVFHLHVRYLGDWDELYFRDYLRAHPDAAAEYAALKINLKQRFAPDRDAYTAAKSDFVRAHTAAARREFGGRYVPGGTIRKG